MMILSRTSDHTGRDAPALTAVVLVAIMLGALILLTACAPMLGTIRVKIDTTCDWFEDQRLSARTKAWLVSNPIRETYTKDDGSEATRFPEYVRRDLGRIGTNNRLALKFCPHIERSPEAHWSGDVLKSSKSKTEKQGQ